MKKKILIGVSSAFVIAIIITTLSLTLFKSNDNVILSDNDNNKNLINNSLLTLMLEQSDGTYQESTSNTWPSGNYAFNESLSRCENGGELSWDREQGIVKLLSNKSDGCYVYFDLYNVVTITNVQAIKTTNSVTLTVTVDAGENPVATYYFSMDNGRSYQTSTSPNYTFSELTPNTTYTFQVYAKDTLGYESNEEVIEVTTDNYVNPVVNSVTTTNTTINSITVSVNATNGTNAIQNYYYSINNGSYVSSSSNIYTFSGLNRGQSYSIRVYVRDTNGVDSNVYTINTETENVVYLADVCNNGNNLASCITSFYNSYGSDATKLYYHNSSLANGAEDNSYRYAGASEEVNNYVCFGSTASTCPEDNLYRIIGVFGSRVKLIKSTSYGNYAWNADSNINTWDATTKPSIYTTLNTTYLNSLENTWSSKIATHSYEVGGMVFDAAFTAKDYYDVEVGVNQTGYVQYMKIGLMYVSDYGFAASNSYWTEILSDYDVEAYNYNWLCLDLSEWTISHNTEVPVTAYYIGRYFGESFSLNQYSIRPVFYLNSNVQYSSGSGTSSDPIIIAI